SLRLAQSSDAGYNLDTPSVVRAKYRDAGPIRGNGSKCIDAGSGTNNGTAIRISMCNGTNAQNWTWNSADGTLRVRAKCMDVAAAGTASGPKMQLCDCHGLRSH